MTDTGGCLLACSLTDEEKEDYAWGNTSWREDSVEGQIRCISSE